MTATAVPGNSVAVTDRASQQHVVERVGRAVASVFTVVPRSYGEMMQVAANLHASGLLPKNISSPSKAFAIIVAGSELGVPPMLALRSIGLIDGKIIVAADLQLGAFKRAGGRSRFMKLDKDGATLWLRHPNGDEHTETFTWQMAVEAKLTTKDNYQKHKVAMMRSRCITAGLKSVGYEPVAGMYDADEATEFAPPVVVAALEAQAGAAAASGTAERDIAEVENISEGERTTESDKESTIGRCPLPGAINGVRYDERDEEGKWKVSSSVVQKIADWASGKAHVAKQIAADETQSKGLRQENLSAATRYERYATEAERELDRREQEQATAATAGVVSEADGTLVDAAGSPEDSKKGADSLDDLF